MRIPPLPLIGWIDCGVWWQEALPSDHHDADDESEGAGRGKKNKKERSPKRKHSRSPSKVSVVMATL